MRPQKREPPKALSLDQVRAEKARRRLRDFVRYGWHVLEPGTPLIWNWHFDAICDHLEAVTRDQIFELVINVPPGHAKSLIVSVFWPAWEWLTKPEERSIFASYEAGLAIRDSVRCRDLLKSPWYQSLFQPDWEFKGDQDVKGYFENTRKGFRFSTSVGAKATGYRGNKVVADDPLNVKDAHSPLARTACINWWDQTMSSRQNDPRKAKRVIIMQRLHGLDLTGHVLKKGGYVHLCLPSEYEPKYHCSTSIGWQDPRKERGELLFPALFTPEVISKAKRDLGSTAYSGQHQQRPSDEEGAILKRKWWRYWVPQGQLKNFDPVSVIDVDGSEIVLQMVELPESFDQIAQSWDCTFKDTDGTDEVAGGVWGKKGSEKYALDLVHKRMDFDATCKSILAMKAKWPKTTAVIVEDKANGPAVISALRKKIAGLIAIEPEGGKLARAYAAQPQQEAGNVILPHPNLYKWVDEMVDQCAEFPNGAFDDVVDETTQVLNWFESRSWATDPEVLRRLREGK